MNADDERHLNHEHNADPEDCTICWPDQPVVLPTVVEMIQRLQTYAQNRDAERIREAEAMFDRLKPKQQRILREAATLGFVEGVRAAGGDREHIPDGRQILFLVLDAARSFDDLYPTLAALEE